MKAFWQQHAPSPPLTLTIALACVFVSGVLFTVADGLAANLLGYLLASAIPFTLVAFVRRESVRRFVNEGIYERRATRVGCVVTLLLGLLAAFAHAYLVARHYA
jgi:uncharacterized membrane protein YdjX (TVP38/TMEM64 family)